jgi:hypothetical protein
MFTAPKPRNFRDIVVRHHNLRPDMKVSPEMIDVAVRAAEERGALLAADGRCYAPFKRATPRFADGRKGRWYRGKIVER